MEVAKLRSRDVGTMLAVLSLVAAVSPAHAYSVYRPVTADGRTGVVIWTETNFIVSGQPAALSFYHYASDAEARQAMPSALCFVKVDLLATNNPPVGAMDEVGNPAIPVNANPADQPRPFPWTVVFNDSPPKRWSIARSEISDAMSNTVASQVAAAGFSSLATTVGSNVTVIDGQLWSYMYPGLCRPE